MIRHLTFIVKMDDDSLAAAMERWASSIVIDGKYFAVVGVQCLGSRADNDLPARVIDVFADLLLEQNPFPMLGAWDRGALIDRLRAGLSFHGPVPANTYAIY